MKKTMVIAMISLLAIWSCQKENEIALKPVPAKKEVKSGDSLISLSGIIWKIDYVTCYMYGTHLLEAGDSTFALRSSSIDLDQYLREPVEVSVNKIDGYPVDFGPVYLDVVSVTVLPDPR
jgi:hypothetical protein